MESIKTKSVLQEQLIEAQDAQKELWEMKSILELEKADFQITERGKSKKRGKKRSPSRGVPTRQICEEAIAAGSLLQIVYITKTNDQLKSTLIPERIATTPDGQHVLVATDQKTEKRLSYNLSQIKHIKTI